MRYNCPVCNKTVGPVPGRKPNRVIRARYQMAKHLARHIVAASWGRPEPALPGDWMDFSSRYFCFCRKYVGTPRDLVSHVMLGGCEDHWLEAQLDLMAKIGEE